MPENLSFVQAAAIPEAWITAYQLLFKIAKIKTEQTALIFAAASGVGTSLIQLCKLAGAHSIAVASSHSKIQICKELGSFDAINYKQYPLFSDRVKLITDGEGVDVIRDCVLGDFFKENLECLAMDSRWVIYGTMGGIKIREANMIKLIAKRANILTSTLRNRSVEYKEELVSDFAQELLPAFSEGKLQPIINKEFGLSEASKALKYMQQNLNIGKIVLAADL